MAVCNVDFRATIVIFLSLSLLGFVCPIACSSVGKVIAAKGSLFAIDDEGVERRLKRRSIIFTGDKIFTGKETIAQIRFDDGALLSLTENSEFLVKKYLYDTIDPNHSVSEFEFLKGGFRTVTGIIAHKKPENYAIKAGLLTVGVRGTSIVGARTNNQVAIGCLDGTAVAGGLLIGPSHPTSFGVSQDVSVTTRAEPRVQPPALLEQVLSLGTALAAEKTGSEEQQDQGQDNSSSDEDKSNDNQEKKDQPSKQGKKRNTANNEESSQRQDKTNQSRDNQPENAPGTESAPRQGQRETTADRRQANRRPGPSLAQSSSATSVSGQEGTGPVNRASALNSGKKILAANGFQPNSITGNNIKQGLDRLAQSGLGLPGGESVSAALQAGLSTVDFNSLGILGDGLLPVPGLNPGDDNVFLDNTKVSNLTGNPDDDLTTPLFQGEIELLNSSTNGFGRRFGVATMGNLLVADSYNPQEAVRLMAGLASSGFNATNPSLSARPLISSAKIPGRAADAKGVIRIGGATIPTGFNFVQDKNTAVTNTAKNPFIHSGSPDSPVYVNSKTDNLSNADNGYPIIWGLWESSTDAAAVRSDVVRKPLNQNINRNVYWTTAVAADKNQFPTSGSVSYANYGDALLSNSANSLEVIKGFTAGTAKNSSNAIVDITEFTALLEFDFTPSKRELIQANLIFTAGTEEWVLNGLRGKIRGENIEFSSSNSGYYLPNAANSSDPYQGKKELFGTLSAVFTGPNVAGSGPDAISGAYSFTTSDGKYLEGVFGLGRCNGTGDSSCFASNNFLTDTQSTDIINGGVIGAATLPNTVLLNPRENKVDHFIKGMASEVSGATAPIFTNSASTTNLNFTQVVFKQNDRDIDVTSGTYYQNEGEAQTFTSGYSYEQVDAIGSTSGNRLSWGYWDLDASGDSAVLYEKASDPGATPRTRNTADTKSFWFTAKSTPATKLATLRSSNTTYIYNSAQGVIKDTLKSFVVGELRDGTTSPITKFTASDVTVDFGNNTFSTDSFKFEVGGQSQIWDTKAMSGTLESDGSLRFNAVNGSISGGSNTFNGEIGAILVGPNAEALTGAFHFTDKTNTSHVLEGVYGIGKKSN